MVTATNGTASFVGVSGTIYQIDLYISDVVAAKCTLNPYGAAVAGSDNFWKTPERVTLYDLSIITGPTVMVGLVPLAAGAPLTTYNFRIANFLNSIQSRPKINVKYEAGQNVGFVQY